MATVLTGKIKQRLHTNESHGPSSSSSLGIGETSVFTATGEKDADHEVGIAPVDRHVAPLGVPAQEKRFFFQRGGAYDPNAIATQVRFFHVTRYNSLSFGRRAYSTTQTLRKSISPVMTGGYSFAPIIALLTSPGKTCIGLIPLHDGHGVKNTSCSARSTFES